MGDVAGPAEPSPDDLGALARGASTCWLVHDAATKRILWANPAACSLFGWTVEELKPLTAVEMSSSAANYRRVIGRSLLQRAVERGTSRWEWHYRTKDGRIVPAETTATKVHLTSGDAILVEIRDIGRELAMERELRRATSFLDVVSRRTSLMAFVLDESGRILFGTDTAMRAIGAQADDPPCTLADYASFRSAGQPKSWADLTSPDERARGVRVEVGDQVPVYLEGTLERLDDPDGQIYLLVLHDVSARVLRQLQQERDRHWENHLARYTAMGDISMAIAHELGQPLAAAANFVAGSLTRLRRRSRAGESAASGDDPVAYGLEQAEAQIERARSIVAAVRAFVGHLEHVEQVIDLNDIVRECHYFIGLRAAESDVEVVLGLAPYPVLIRCERVLTGQVVLNLVNNAIGGGVRGHLHR